ncbi:MAG: transporter substrate-binding domain-containing protein [Rhodospirillales bacterium]
MPLKIPALLAAILVCAATIAHADPVLDRAKTRGSLVAAAVPDQLPLAARDASGTLTGFDIAVAQELGKRLDLPVTFVTPGWDAILSGDEGGQWDFAVASITPTPRRAEKLSFPALYRLDATVAVVRADEKKIQRPRDASGKTIGVMANTTFQRYLNHSLSLEDGTVSVPYLIEDPKVETFPSNNDALQALVQGKVEAVVTTLSVAAAARKGGQAIRILPGFLYFEPVAVATAKGDPQFDAAVAEAIVDMRADGTLSRLSTEWFGIDLGTIFP